MLAYSFHLLQPLNVGLYLFLKFAYGHQINLFICIFINHITKTEFFIIYLVIHNAIFTKQNIKRKFRGIGISFWDLNFIISKFNVYFCTLTIFSFHSNSTY